MKVMHENAEFKLETIFRSEVGIENKNNECICKFDVFLVYVFSRCNVTVADLLCRWF